MKTQAVIPAAGSGTRLDSPVLKPFVLLDGRPVFFYTLDVLERCPLIDSVILSVPADYIEQFKDKTASAGFKKVRHIVGGGPTRSISVRNGLRCLDEDTRIVLIHDAARPLVSLTIVEELVRLGHSCEAVISAVAVKPTIKRVNPATMLVQETLRRDELWEIQTPQVFRRDILLNAHQQNNADDATDDAVLVERMGIPVKVVKGDYENIKITTSEDLIIAEQLLQKRRQNLGLR